MSDTIISANIQAIATVVTPILAATLFWIYEYRKEKLEKAKAFRELFNEFNKRFDKLNKSLNIKRSLSTAGYALPEKYKSVIQDYLNLCAEEYLWYTKNLIDVKIWHAWLNGIEYYLEVPEIKSHFQTELTSSAQSSYYGLAKALSNRIK